MVFTLLVDSASGTEPKMVKKGHNSVFDWTNNFPSVARVDDIEVWSQKALEQMTLDLTEGLREIGPEVGHANTNWSSLSHETHGYKRESQKWRGHKYRQTSGFA